ncbi:MAG: DNA lyase [Firmicutes bacterium]|nr:DNA lyase [Dethiobacter sp.]MBS3888452.1 DNA lyase [Bacillota bacterium]MBS4055064.1 DNA lyase [Thermaerobacter sp.]
MRIWSLHPQYLDAKGLVALWREALLAQAVLKGATQGYKNHPQLHRFLQHHHPVGAIDYYLQHVWREAHKRGYNFDPSKLYWGTEKVTITLTLGQLNYEWSHLREKLRLRDPSRLQSLQDVVLPCHHPIFVLAQGGVADWEKVT